MRESELKKIAMRDFRWKGGTRTNRSLALHDRRALLQEVFRLREELARRPVISVKDAFDATNPHMRSSMEPEEVETNFAARRRIEATLLLHGERYGEQASSSEADVCGKRCDHDSECLKLRGHEGGHETQHGCVFYDVEENR